jgi:diguanylate cyclase (GGDEF)-like protein/PAS domain S-box-containing protein
MWALGRFFSDPTEMRKSASISARFLSFGAYTLTYLVVARILMLLINRQSEIALIWPTCGLALGMLLTGRPSRRAEILAAVFLANTLAHILAGGTLLLGLGLSLVLSLEALVSMLLLLHFFGTPITFVRVNEAVGLLAVILGVIPAAAVAGTGMMTLAAGSSFEHAGLTRWASDLVGLLLLTPLMVAWSDLSLGRLQRDRRALVEYFLLTLLLVLSAWGVFLMPQQGSEFISIVSRAYIVLPFLFWAAVRFDLRMVSLMFILLAGMAFWGTGRGLGRFVFPSTDPRVHVLTVQVYLGFATFTSILLNSAMAQVRNSAAALRENEQRYLDVLNFVRLIAIQVDRSARITFTNEFLLEVSGWRSDELQGKCWLEALFPPEGRLEGERIFAEVTSHRGYHAHFTSILLTSGGDQRQISWDLIALHDTAGRVIGMTAIGDDITERICAENNLKAANKALETRLAEIEGLQSTLREQAFRDSLTGLYNRRYLDETVDRELARASRDIYPVSILMIDIDHFKEFNDTYGHKTGDYVLAELGKLLHGNIRHGDIACRYGGEEFVVVMSNTHIDDAHLRAEKLRQTFGNAEMCYDGRKFSATLSAGIAAYPQHGGSWELLIRRADAAMYKSKNAGRNRITLA